MRIGYVLYIGLVDHATGHAALQQKLKSTMLYDFVKIWWAEGRFWSEECIARLIISREASPTTAATKDKPMDWLQQSNTKLEGQKPCFWGAEPYTAVHADESAADAEVNLSVLNSSSWQTSRLVHIMYSGAEIVSSWPGGGTCKPYRTQRYSCRNIS